MTKFEVSEVLARIDALWPKAGDEWASAQREVVSARLARLNITAEQAIAVVNDVWAGSQYRSPPRHKLIARWDALYQSRADEARMVAQRRPEPEARTDGIAWTEYIAGVSEGRYEAGKPGGMVAVAVARYRATGEVPSMGAGFAAVLDDADQGGKWGST